MLPETSTYSTSGVHAGRQNRCARKLDNTLDPSFNASDRTAVQRWSSLGVRPLAGRSQGDRRLVISRKHSTARRRNFSRSATWAGSVGPCGLRGHSVLTSWPASFRLAANSRAIAVTRVECAAHDVERDSFGPWLRGQTRNRRNGPRIEVPTPPCLKIAQVHRGQERSGILDLAATFPSRNDRQGWSSSRRSEARRRRRARDSAGQGGARTGLRASSRLRGFSPEVRGLTSWRR